ncbi:MAG: hypothetical protein FD167_4007 [bacterium]|nr:MAG: hypothetical protein FD167_4007 [bacterium]
MLINHNREKLKNAILYFATKVNNCGKVKLCKLLYLLDFYHFKETGYNVTGLDYHAWEMGPVPKTAYDELNDPSSDIHKIINIVSLSTSYDNDLELIQPVQGIEFSSLHFSRRHLRLLEELATKYKDKTAREMITETHEVGSPWHTVYRVESSPYSVIPYSYILADLPEEDKEDILERAREHQKMEELFS